MIKRSKRVVITFHTTTDAMAMEQACKEEHVEGRIIPVPSFITAGCGLAWCGPVEKENEYKEVMQNNAITWEEIQICMV